MLLLVLASLSLGGCDLSEKAYMEAESINTVESYEQYLQKYPSSEFAGKARWKLDELRWLIAKKAQTVDACTDFLNTYPESFYKDSVAIQIDEILWKQAYTADSLPALTAYLSGDRYRTHIAEAEERIEILRETGDVETQILRFLGYKKGMSNVIAFCGSDAHKGKLGSCSTGNIYIEPGSSGAETVTFGDLDVRFVGQYGTENWTFTPPSYATVTFQSGRIYSYDGAVWRLAEMLKADSDSMVVSLYGQLYNWDGAGWHLSKVSSFAEKYKLLNSKKHGN
jgi:hypothetical protein